MSRESATDSAATSGRETLEDQSPSRRAIRLPSWMFFVSIGALGMLPVVPELWLCFRHYDDLRTFASIAYYEGIASFALLAPTLLFRGRWSRGWTVGVGTVFTIATLVTGFQALAVGARWDSTAHAAVMETNPYESWGFIHAFVSAGTMLKLIVIGLAFSGCIFLNLRSELPRMRFALLGLGLAGCLSGYGVYHMGRYGGNPVHATKVTNDITLNLVEAGINSYHPVSRLAVTQWNFAATHAYRLRVLREMNQHLAALRGATAVPGATPPRVILIVIGESASRRHWSLYGYQRPTTPELAALGDNLLVYRDTICRTVGTLTEIQGMLCAPQSSLPVLALFSAAGYQTHWFSTQLDQGPNDVKLAALVQACDDRVFLNGAYDENLVPLVERAVRSPGRHVIIVNLFGSHVRYEDRYPDGFAVFRDTGDKGRRLAAYDNTIRYTDHVLATLITVLRGRVEPSCFLYVSDHAEDVYDSNPDEYRFRSDSVATDAMYEVPLVMWFSPEYGAGNRDLVEAAKRACTAPIQSRGLYHTLIDLARLRHPIYNPAMSIVSAEFQTCDRMVGAAPRVYHPRLADQTGNGEAISYAHPGTP